jgi:predicted nuclease with TOPRIM domain
MGAEIMAKHLTDKDIANVVEILDEWPAESKLTWDKLVDAVEHEYKFKTTRQTLQNPTRIKIAFKEVKKLISGNLTTNNKSLPPSLKIAAARLEKYENKIERLEFENQKLLEQFHVWLYNANRFGIKIEQLSEALPSKDNQ